MPGCSLCMGNQARVKPGATVVSTSTRNFPNRLGKGAFVYLSSAELAAVAALLGRLPTVDEYMQYIKDLAPMSSEIYRYLNFNEIEDFQRSADSANTSSCTTTTSTSAIPGTATGRWRTGSSPIAT